ncbi:MAG: hypothetical protein JWN04_4550 [Myxococcaceae bacterium]|nr:hypothetical protein [Myxococcaceae bacterium]
MKMSSFRTLVALSLVCLSLSCGNPGSATSRRAGPSPDNLPSASAPAAGSVVKPPFEVKGEAQGLLLVWYDDHGDLHLANQRSEIPEDRRASVRVDALELAPEQRLDPAFVYVADLREAGKDGLYSVRKVPRDSFESALPTAPSTALAEATGPAAEPAVPAASSEVIIYGASGCGACTQAAQFFRRKGVPFIEKDIEKEPTARSEMMAKAKSQGVRTGGIPVIDVRGTLLGGFNAQRIEQLLASN